MRWILIVPSILLWIGVAVLLRPPRRPTWLAALGWLALWTAPAAIYQSLWIASDASPYSVDGSGLAVLGVAALWVLLGGRTVIVAFEGLADLGMSRQATMLDNLPIFFLLVAVQTALLVWVLVRSSRSESNTRVWILVGVAVLANALFGAHWPFWGS